MIGFTPALDNVSEVKVQTTLLDAQYGRSNGGAVSVSTKGGTNELHGAVYWFKRWTALNANSWNNNRLGLPIAPVKYDQYGYVVSGPVFLPRIFDGRNRLFFSTNLEQDREPRELTRRARMPTGPERGGDFAQTLNLRGGALGIFDPATTVVTGNTARRTAFPGNRIPPSRISPIGRAAMALFAQPNNAIGPSQLGAFNWRQTGTYVVEQRNFSTRVDLALSQRQRLFGRASRLWRTQASDDGFGFEGAFSFPPDGTRDLGLNKRWFTSFALDDTYTFSPTLFGSLRYGIVRYLSRVTNGAVGADPAKLNLPSAIAANQAVRGYPVFNFMNNENVAGIGSSFSTSADEQHSLVATVHKVIGSHTLKFGSDYRRTRRNNSNPGAAAPGTFTFGSVFTREDPFNPRSADTESAEL